LVLQVVYYLYRILKWLPLLDLDYASRLLALQRRR
jgi:hypothetical protein